jgi:hypothetical protein
MVKQNNYLNKFCLINSGCCVEVKLNIGRKAIKRMLWAPLRKSVGKQY